MYRFMNQPGVGVTDLRKQRRILLIALIVLIAALAVVGALGLKAMNAAGQVDAQLNQRMLNNVTSAIDQANLISSVVSSDTAARVGMVRQHVYAMDEINRLSIALHGESGRLASQAAFDALYADLNNFTQVIQQATTSTLDVRTLLMNHLTALRDLLMD